MSENILLHLIENAGDGIVGISGDGTVTLWNKSAEGIFGYTKSEAIDQNIGIIMPHDSTHKKETLFDKIISSGEVIRDFKVEGIGKDGEKVVVVGTVSPVKGHSGGMIGVSWIFRMLSGTDYIPKDVAHFDKLISLGKLAAETAHQINSPLGAVSGRIQLLLKNLEKVDKEVLNRNLKQMLDSCKHVEIAVGRLLSFARIPKRIMKPVDINTVIDDVLDMMSHKLMLKMIKVNKVCTENLPKVMGIYEELVHAFVNIVSNAIDAMDKGCRLEIATDINKLSEELPESKVRVTISDNGHGISEEDLKSIFDPFFTTKEEGKGTGLGLFIVKRAVEMHDGSIDVLSKLNHGTSFIIFFPCLINDGK